MTEESMEGFYLSPQQDLAWKMRLGERKLLRVAVGFRGPLDPSVLKQALDHLVARHEVLRTSFQIPEVMNVPLQYPMEGKVFWRDPVDLTGGSVRDGVAALMEEEVHLDMEQGPFLHGTLATHEDGHVLVLYLSELSMDLSSLGLFASDLANGYQQVLNGEEPDEPSMQYLDYAIWRNDVKEEEEANGTTNHWEALTLPEDIPLPFQKAVEEPMAPAYMDLAVLKPDGAPNTLQSRLLALWFLQLYRLNFESDLVCGVFFDGREFDEIQETLGPLGAFLPVTLPLSHGDTVNQLFEKSAACLEETGEFQSLYFPKEAAELNYGFDFTHHQGERQVGDLSIFLEDHLLMSPPFRLRLSCQIRRNDLVCRLYYDANRFEPAQIQMMADQFHRLYTSQNLGGKQLWNISLLADEQARVAVFNDHREELSDNPNDLVIHRLIEQWADRHPDWPAVNYEGDMITYGELNRAANQWAGLLLQRGVASGDRVVIYMDRSVSMITAVLAVWKANAAYTPVDLGDPAGRVAAIVADCGARFLLTHREHFPDRSLAFADTLSVTCLDFADGAPKDQSSENPDLPCYWNSPAYAVYTSGSTGKPKGVVVEHRAPINLLVGLQRLVFHDVEAPLKVTMNAPLSFDASMQQIIMLTAGHCLHPIPQKIRLNADAMIAWLSQWEIDVLDTTPTHLNVLVEAGLLETKGPVPHKALVAGGAINQGMWDRLAQAPNTDYYDIYGPTECTVDASGCLIDKPGLIPSIGGPLLNYQLYVVDAWLQPVPDHVPGQLAIGGYGLARGYLGQPGMTATAFVPSPFSTVGGERIYLTGDKVRFLEDDRLEFLGRVDYQVKISGVRVEPEEIERVIGEHPQVASAVVVARKQPGGDPHLAAYYTSASGSAPDESQIREYLKGKLPETMVPTYFTPLAEIPLKVNGKVDRARLPEPQEPESAKTGNQARTDTERDIAEVWADLLGLHGVDIDKNFFELGGHSLIATQIVTRLRALFNLEITIQMLFTHATVKDLARRIDGMNREKTLGVREPMIRQEKGSGPLSFSQQRLWFLDRLHPGEHAYNIPMAFRLQGELDAEILQKCLDFLVVRHGSLRTRFFEDEEGPYQIIESPFSPRIERIDASEGGLNEVGDLTRGLSAHVFDLSSLPLFRITLVKLGPKDHVLVVVVHHTIFDGWSTELLTHEVAQCYAAYQAGKEPDLPELPVRFLDYAYWQRQWLGDEALEQLLTYWRVHMENAPETLTLPHDFARPTNQTFDGARLEFHISSEVTARLRLLCRETGASLFMGLMACYKALLSTYSGQTDICVGTPIANRNIAELEGIIGLFANTLVMRSDLSGSPSFKELLARVRKTALDAYAHQDMPFEKLVSALQTSRRTDISPLFQAEFMFNQTRAAGAEIPGLELSGLLIEHEVSKFDLTLHMSPKGDGLHGELIYNTDLFLKETMSHMCVHFQQLTEMLATHPETPFNRLSCMPSDERTRMVVAWNQSWREFQGSPFLFRRLEEQAMANPDRPALRFEGEMMTYGQLDRKVNRLAHYLRSKGVGPDTPVGMLMTRSFEMVIGIFGIQKAGGAYVPLDPDLPAGRLAVMAEILPLALTQNVHQPLADQLDTPMVVMDDNGEDAPFRLDMEDAAHLKPPELDLSPDNTAYIFYTSGSTGKPKAVMVSHRAITNRTLWCQAFYPLEPDRRVLLRTAFGFDVSVGEFFWPLAVGASIVIARPGSQRDMAYVSDLIQTQSVNILHLAPSVLSVFLEQTDPGLCHSLDAVICNGESLTADLRRRFGAKLDTTLYNFYGPTEAAVNVTAWDTTTDPYPGRVPIGGPISNIQLYITNHQLEPLPVKVAGELLIGGTGLARGYMGRPGLTAERFIPDPFSTTPGTRLYRTGDLSCYFDNGGIDILGRIDFQVKIRGFRIELGEIESVLRDQSQVHEAVVLVMEDGPSQQLVAYVLPEDGQEPDQEILTANLKKLLPDYMVPSVFMTVAAWPLNVSGKLDRKALPKPDRSVPDRMFIGPRSPEEKKLTEVWSEVLGVPEIGIHDGFFELGGDSLLSIQVVTRASARGLHFKASDLFHYQTIAELAPHASPFHVVRAKQSPIRGTVTPGPVQQWFLDQNRKNPHHFNQALYLNLRKPLTTEMLELALRKLCYHHDALRLRFTRLAGGWSVTNAGPGETSEFVIFKASSDNPDDEAFLAGVQQQAQSALNIGKGPLLSATLVEGGDVQRLLVVVHHLVTDAVSWRIIIEDLETLCRASGGVGTLPPKTTSFQEWTRHLSTFASDATQLQTAPWLSHNDAPVALTPDRPEGLNTSALVDKVTVILDEGETGALLRNIASVYETRVNDLLLTALVLGFGKINGSHDVLLDMEAMGREQLVEDVDLSRTVGWFTSIYPLRLKLPVEVSLKEAILSVKEQIRAIGRNGMDFGLARYLNPELSRELEGRTPAAVSFNYLGQLDRIFHDSEWFEIRQTPPGPMQEPNDARTHELNVICVVAGGKMMFNWHYSTDRFDRETIQNLADACLEALSQLIDHCSNTTIGARTPSDFPLVTIDRNRLDKLVDRYGVMEDLYPLSPLQTGILLFNSHDGGSGLYISQISASMRNLQRPDLFLATWQTVCDRHPILRTLFLFGTAGPMQLVLPSYRVTRTHLDCRGIPNMDAYLSRFKEFDLKQGFRMEEEPLIRITLLRVGEDDWQFVLTFHLAILDGWSMQNLFSEVAAIYSAQVQGQELELKPVAPYGNYLAWIGNQDRGKATQFWKDALGDFSEPNQIAADQEGTGVFQSRQIEAVLDGDNTLMLNSFARRHGLTLNTLLQGAWTILISRYSGSDDVLFGVVASGRPADLEGVEDMVGLFINTLPLRMNVDNGMTLIPWLHEIQLRQAHARGYDYFTLAELQLLSQVPHGRSLFETLLVFENYPMNEAAAKSLVGLELKEVEAHEQMDYPLSLAVVPNEEMLFRFEFDGNRFDDTFIKTLQKRLFSLLKNLPAMANRLPAECPILTYAEQEKVLNAFNATQMDWDRNLCIHQWFEAQVARTPDRVAIRFQNQSWTYAQINARANRVAHALMKRGLGPEVPVGICMSPTPDLVAGLLGVLKSGGYYVPLDPSHPLERLKYICGVVGLTQVLCQTDTVEAWRDTDMVCLDGLWARLEDFPDHNPNVPVDPRYACYTIFTSGSTGKPKGVSTVHHCVVNFLRGMLEAPGIHFQDRVLALATLSFDPSVLELYLPLLVGARVIMVTRDTAVEPRKLAAVLKNEGVTVMQATPTTWTMLFNAGFRGKSDMRCLCGGEALTTDLATRILGHTDSLWNVYGPTETTVWCTRSLVKNEKETHIGAAVENVQIYVLNKRLQPQPVGLPGEMVIGGAGMNRGYHGRPDLTAERFIPNPFTSGLADAGSRLYKTGDLARWLPDGNLEYLGRFDHQIKIRGHRIEQGEIETVLRGHPQVDNGAVIAKADATGQLQLVGFYTGIDADEPLSAEALSDYLRERLPEYMVPSQLSLIDSMPMTTSKKIDRGELGRRITDASINVQNQVAPRNPTEESLVELWCSLLKIPSVGVTDNFFEIGGHSLLATTVLAWVAENCDTEISYRELFENPTIEMLATRIHLAQIDSAQDDGFSDMLDEVADMSPEEIQALLESDDALTEEDE